MPRNNYDWSAEELLSAIRAYLRMLRNEIQGQPYNKAEINRSLREGILNRRSKSSIEYRMQNISAVLEEICLPGKKGYFPAKNLGPSVRAKIRQLLTEEGMFNPAENESSADNSQLDEKVSILRRKIGSGIPKGTNKPAQAVSTTAVFYRDPLVKAWILNQANGVCEACESVGPFKTTYGDVYLEVHHVKPLSEGGSDTIYNSIALCPNCHRRCHQSIDREHFAKSLYKKVTRLKSEA
ncbi:MAG: HNH endonuclease [Syntrophaceae bacterium]|nr:HNH endonuclease [Syntrophaceae bacterium]